LRGVTIWLLLAILRIPAILWVVFLTLLLAVCYVRVEGVSTVGLRLRLASGDKGLGLTGSKLVDAGVEADWRWRARHNGTGMPL